MIRWPSEKRFSVGARKGIARFRETSAAADLAADSHTWEIEATSWIDELPIRIVLRNEARREVCFTMDDPKIWTLVTYETAPVCPDENDPLTPLGRRR